MHQKVKNMSDNQHQNLNQDKSMTYTIHIKGHLGHDWEDWFDNVSITQADEETILTCAVRDQSALYGLLRRIRDLGVTLISVIRVEPDNPEA